MNIEELIKENTRLNLELRSKDQQIQSKDQHILHLEDTILLLRRKKFAPSSEALKNEPQLMLFNELEDIEDSSDETSELDDETITYTRKKRGKRSALPDHLPREEEILDLSEEEKKGMKYIGDEITEKLEIRPAKIWVRRIIRKKYAPIDSASDMGIKLRELPAQLLPKSLAGSSLVAYIITGKYCDALPLYRQEKIFTRIQADLKRQSMARWLIRVSEQLVPLYNLMQDICLDRTYLQMDETRVQVLKEDGKKATSKSYMWVRYSPGKDPIVLYDYSPTRSGAVPKELLTGFKGILQVDGYDGYSSVCTENNLMRAGCWDHARRKFFDAAKSSSGKNTGKKALNIIKKLYKIEEEIKDLPNEQRLKIRQEKSVPILDKLKDWIDEVRGKITPKSLAGKAINYAFNEWKYLDVFAHYPQVNISNTWVENSIRPFAIGRKNWLFSNSVEGAQASAMYYSLIETAKANGLEPFDYLNRMLDKLPAANTIEDYQRLLPFKVNFTA